ncbi:hypothetical protein Droror1_Dr00011694 [Drosera rotundifolia]
METHGLRADCLTYAELIKCCIARNAVKEGRIVAKHVCSNGYERGLFLINNVMNMYAKFGMLGDVEKLFVEMPERNVVSWTTMISGYSKGEMGWKALGLFVLIDVYAKWCEVSDALGVFDEMRTGDSIVWSLIIGTFAQNNDDDEALNLFKRMKRAGFVAHQVTLTSTLRACTGLGLLELGRQVHVHVFKYNKDLILNNALLDMYCKCGGLEDANTIFSRMEEKDVIS